MSRVCGRQERDAAVGAPSLIDELRRRLTDLAVQLWPSAHDVDGLTRLSGGASPETWAFDLLCPQGVSPMVLRRRPPRAGGCGEGRVGLETEAALIELAQRAGVPVAPVLAVLRPCDALGTGFIAERIEGEAIARRIVGAPGLARARQRLAWQCGQALACIHHIPIGALPPLRPAPATLELAHCLAQHRGHGTARPVFELAFQWLDRHAAGAPIKPALLHGDFRNGNLIVGDDGLRAVLGWAGARLGDPMEDLGWMCLKAWRHGGDSLSVGGFGTREELFAGYEDAGGRIDLDRVRFWEVFGTLKQGVLRAAMAPARLVCTGAGAVDAAPANRVSQADIDLLELLAPRPASRPFLAHR